MAVSRDFWRDKTVLVTGHSGFKGAWLSLWLHKLGAKVIGFALDPPTTPNLYELARIEDCITSVRRDVRDIGAITATIDEYRPGILIHMAAQSLVRPSYLDPVLTYTTNVLGTVNVLEAARHAQSIRVVINITSDKCYENSGRHHAFVESDPMGGHDPYSSSKGCAELVTAAYQHSYFAPGDALAHPRGLASVRAGNVIGGGDWAKDRLIPDLITAFMEGRPAQLRNPRAIRPWQHVLEPLSGYLCLAQCLWNDGPDFSGGWNFGPEQTDIRPVAWVADAVAALWGDDAQWAVAEGDHPHEAPTLRLDCAKAKERLHWTPRLSLAEALEWTVAWYRAYAGDQSLRYLTEQQIDQYAERQP
jgi:CDP-glucose 4,6-dehydratase